MKRLLSIFLCVLCVFTCINCRKKNNTTQEQKIVEKGTFAFDVEFLSAHKETIVLHSKDEKAQVLICADYQGRVMTSTAEGPGGKSFGWMNYELISAGKVQEHINAFGGEDRFWLGPEGGQFSIFFKPGAEFIFDDWATPAAIDTEPFNLLSKTDRAASFTKKFSLQNYSGLNLDVKIDREIILSEREEIERILKTELPEEVSLVGFSSRNRITNIGENTWNREQGALSIWILGMFNPSPNTTIVIPYRQGEEASLGAVVNDSYFGKVPSERLIIDDGVIYFSADGQYRSKIGINPLRVLPIAGSYDADNNVLTVIQIDPPTDVTDYVNSMWELQEEPFSGDVINSYNDGPVDGVAMGPFYELESSSPAAFLKPGASLVHVHRTVHITGSKESLDRISKAVFGVGIQDIESAF